MLTPILAVKTVTPSVSAVPVRDNPAREPSPARQPGISGQRSEAALRILETLNRQLVGAGVLPKEALARLLETLSRLLKVPALPQESLRDFGRRIATAIEALPPGARLALEKQLGQRNLSLSVRILAEVLKGMPLPDTTRRPEGSANMPQRAATDSTTGGIPRMTPSAAGQTSLPPPARLPGTATPVPTPLTAVALSTGGFDAGALQAALRSAFNVDDDTPSDTVSRESAEDIDGRPARQDTAARNERAAGPASPQRPASGDTPMPALNAVIRFLAGDPVALAHVVAIASGGIDEEPYRAAKQALEENLPLESALSTEEPPQGSSLPEVNSAAVSLEPQTEEQQAASGVEAFDPAADIAADEDVAEYAPYDSGTEATETDAGAPARVSSDDAQTNAPTARNESHEPSAASGEPSISQRTMRTIADALQTLVDSGIPLPSDGLNEPLEQALSGFSPLAADDGQPAGIDGKPPLATGSLPAREGAAGEASPAQDMSGEADPAQHDAARLASRPVAAEEQQREALSQKMPDTVAFRESIPFLAMPVAIRSDDRRPVPAQEDEPQGSAGQDQEEASDRKGGDDEDAKQDGSAASAREPDLPDEDDAGDAYALYSRLGGLS